MSVTTAPENITKAFTLLRERIKPAVLDQTSEANGKTMHAYIAAQGYNVLTTDADTLANLMYQALSAKAAEIVWTVKPKKLTIRQEDNRASFKDETNFAEKVRKAAEADAVKKEAAKSRGITAGLISQMQLSSHGKTELYRNKLHARVERAVKQGVAWTAIQADISRKVAELYAADEKSQERVGQFRDTLSEVEL